MPAAIDDRLPAAGEVFSTRSSPFYLLGLWSIWHALIVSPPSRALNVSKILKRAAGPYYPEPYVPMYREILEVPGRPTRTIRRALMRGYIFVPRQTFERCRALVEIGKPKRIDLMRELKGIELMRRGSELRPIPWPTIARIMKANTEADAGKIQEAPHQEAPRFEVGDRIKYDLFGSELTFPITAIKRSENQDFVVFNAPFFGRMTAFDVPMSKVRAASDSAV